MASGQWQDEFVRDPRYARQPQRYLQASLLLQKDLLELFDYVEPAEANNGTVSFRIHALLMRTCMEIEANCKAILAENGYRGGERWNITDYRKIESSHRLSGYRVLLPRWTGSARAMRQPFASWSGEGPLPWYRDYNVAKHDTQADVDRATFDSAIDAMCGLVALIHAQFADAFDNTSFNLTLGPTDGSQATAGGYFRVIPPVNWPIDDRYEFDWARLKDTEQPFASFDYSTP